MGIESRVDEGSTEKKNEDGSMTVTVNKKKPILWRIRHFFEGLRFEQPFRRRWLMQMWVFAAFFTQGTLGLLTLTLFRRNLTAKPSSHLAVARSVVHELKLAEADAKEKGEEAVAFESPDVEENMDEWMKQFTDKKVYDAKGKYLGRESEME